MPMASMKCPHCGKPCTRLIARADIDHLFCDGCRPEGKRKDAKLYTGRKSWAGQECMSSSKLEEHCFDYGRQIKERAKETQRSHMARKMRSEVLSDGLESKARAMLNG